MENLKKLAMENIKKQSYVRVSMGKLMEKWESITEGCEIIASKTALYTNNNTGYQDHDFFLVTGNREIKTFDEPGMYDISGSRCFWDVLPIRDLRRIALLLPIAIQEVVDSMKETNDQNNHVITLIENMLK